jgi:hypothetical protein
MPLQQLGVDPGILLVGLAVSMLMFLSPGFIALGVIGYQEFFEGKQLLKKVAFTHKIDVSLHRLMFKNYEKNIHNFDHAEEVEKKAPIRHREMPPQKHFHRKIAPR